MEVPEKEQERNMKNICMNNGPNFLIMMKNINTYIQEANFK
jgi:hypothetical protein